MIPLVLLTGPTASGKSALALALAQRFGAEILSCDSVAVYRHMELGTAKPTARERALVPHHLLDLYDPDQTCTAGDYARAARNVLPELATRNTLPILSGGTGLYARALVDGLSPAPLRDPALRALLTQRAVQRGSDHLHRTLQRMDPTAAARIHPHDIPKLIRAIEVSLSIRTPITRHWAEQGREPLSGYRVLRLTLNPPRQELYARINQRAAAMFAGGLIAETAALIARFGAHCPPLAALGYREATSVLMGQCTESEAIARACQSHRNYAKRQLTWFRREAELHPTHTLPGPGDSPAILAQAIALLTPELDHHASNQP